MSYTNTDTSAMRPEIAEIFMDVFQYDGPIAPHTCPDDVERWDSLQHIALVRVLEERFEISMTMDEMMELRSAGDIESVLARHGV